ncbi:hypothetical protein BDP27DRAFT_1400247 [Rhodocollybia butyracea]|uniref:Uncharacterized protein n=1 Tax=Rhodocollybia butyracea TaxID=206335 RepID=A0A9P5UBQ8_9AGAR|nr:hypothetical protein BDP27DRAFT_1400247 [Rhodocollybia butyracea]
MSPLTGRNTEVKVVWTKVSQNSNPATLDIQNGETEEKHSWESVISDGNNVRDHIVETKRCNDKWETAFESDEAGLSNESWVKQNDRAVPEIWVTHHKMKAKMSRRISPDRGEKIGRLIAR